MHLERWELSFEATNKEAGSCGVYSINCLGFIGSDT